MVLLITVLFILPGCSAALPRWKEDAARIVSETRRCGTDSAFIAEYESVLDTFRQGEDLQRNNDFREADERFRFALMKGLLLEKNFEEETRRQAADELRRAQEEAERRERERVLQEEQLNLRRTTVLKNAEKNRQSKEKALPSSHIVKRGETLPQIAAQPDVYNDSRLWPLLYRANRDQVGDPRHVWPGQTLRIPRNLTREDILEARRLASEKPI